MSQKIMVVTQAQDDNCLVYRTAEELDLREIQEVKFERNLGGLMMYRDRREG